MEHHDRFVAEVIDIFDPELSARLKIRIFGLHDDTTRIPDDMLPWARCVFPVTNPIHDGTSGPTTGLVIGSIVVGYFADHAKQVPLITGSMGGVSQNIFDFPKIDRGEDFNEVLNNALPAIALPSLKFPSLPSIASIPFTGQGISGLLDQVGLSGIASAVSSIEGVISSFDSLTSAISSATSLDSLPSMIQSFAFEMSGQVVSAVDQAAATAQQVASTAQQVSSALPSQGVHSSTSLSPASSSAPTVSQTQTRAKAKKGVSTLATTQRLAAKVTKAEIKATKTGAVIAPVDQNIDGGDPNAINTPLTDTINDLAGNIATRTSKTPITTIEDTLDRINGHKFVMSNVMPHLEEALNMLMEQ